MSGELIKAARLHQPKIKNVKVASTAGAPLVGFNCDAFESYGFGQGDNAPMSDSEAFRYCTALNILTGTQRAHIEETTLVYWTGAARCPFTKVPVGATMKSWGLICRSLNVQFRAKGIRNMSLNPFAPSRTVLVRVRAEGSTPGWSDTQLLRRQPRHREARPRHYSEHQEWSDKKCRLD